MVASCKMCDSLRLCFDLWFPCLLLIKPQRIYEQFNDQNINGLMTALKKESSYQCGGGVTSLKEESSYKRGGGIIAFSDSMGNQEVEVPRK